MNNGFYALGTKILNTDGVPLNASFSDYEIIAPMNDTVTIKVTMQVNRVEMKPEGTTIVVTGKQS